VALEARMVDARKVICYGLRRTHTELPLKRTVTVATRIFRKVLVPSGEVFVEPSAIVLVLLAIAGCSSASPAGADAMDGGLATVPADASMAETQTQAADGPNNAVMPSDASSLDGTASYGAAVLDGETSDASSDASLSDSGASLSNLDASPPDSTVADAWSSADAAATVDAVLAGWKLTWSDEFDGPQGAPPDKTKWTPQIGVSGSNGELEYYTGRASNLALDGSGHLLITGLREAYMGSNYTSARIDTAGKFAQMYGRFESRMKLPVGQGLWPAFWMLGSNIGQVGWPTCGEIDIMENIGRAPTQNNGAIHGLGYTGANITKEYILPGGYSSDFHVFAAEVEQNVVRLYVDDNLYMTETSANLAGLGGGLMWAFNQPFYMILNVAIGGGYPGNPNNTTPFPQSLTVDYVRVYSR
jgi:beta-glucanase (GH16 family)